MSKFKTVDGFWLNGEKIKVGKILDSDDFKDDAEIAYMTQLGKIEKHEGKPSKGQTDRSVGLPGSPEATDPSVGLPGSPEAADPDLE